MVVDIKVKELFLQNGLNLENSHDPADFKKQFDMYNANPQLKAQLASTSTGGDITSQPKYINIVLITDSNQGENINCLSVKYQFHSGNFIDEFPTITQPSILTVG